MLNVLENFAGMKWARFEGNLNIFFGNGSIDWDGCGFSIPSVSAAVNMGFQQTNEDGVMISWFPVINTELFEETILPIGTTPYGSVRYVTEEEATAERDSIKAIVDAKLEQDKNTPSEDDIYKAQQLLLLTKIYNKLGDNNG